MGDPKMKVDHNRAERLLSDLAHFVQGQESMSARSEAIPGQKSIATVLSQQDRVSVSSLASLPTTVMDQSPSDISAVDSALRSPDISFTLTTRTTTSFSGTGEEMIGASSTSSTGNEVRSTFDPYPEDGQLAIGSVPAPYEAIANVSSTFSRASNLIREAVDVDAATFLETPHEYRFKNRRGWRVPSEALDRCSSNPLCTPISDSDNLADYSDGSQYRKRLDTEVSRSTTTFCRRLGFATKLRSSLAGSTVMNPFLTISLALPHRLALSYPEGHIFHFDCPRSTSSNDEDKIKTTSECKPIFQQKYCHLVCTVCFLVRGAWYSYLCTTMTNSRSMPVSLE